LEAKLLEIRDIGTYIPVLAVKLAPWDKASVREAGIDAYHLKQTGYGPDGGLVLLVRLDGPRAEHDPFKWGFWWDRSMREAHKYIEENFSSLEYGAVVDVEYILGETARPRESQRTAGKRGRGR